MGKPYEIDKEFRALEPNFELIAKLYTRHQKDYLRKRLKAIQMLWEGKSRNEVMKKLDIDRKTLIKWINTLVDLGVEQGLKLLVKAKCLKKSGKLTPEQQESLIEILEQESPNKYGYAQNIFTGKIFVEIVRQKWDIEVSDQTIYNMFDRQGFSYQRGHRDYENADPEQQQAYAERLKDQFVNKSEEEKQMFFDEFSVSNRPTTFYGWARKNTRHRVSSNESKKRERVNGLLAVDTDSGKEYISLTESAKTEDIADYFYDLSLLVKREGYSLLRITLDNNSTHKDKMRYQLWLKLRSNPELQDFRVIFNNTPAYSPDFNVAEYIIHQLRLQLLHHLPANITLEEIKVKIVNYLKTKQLQTKEQIKNTINRILKLGGVTCGI